MPRVGRFRGFVICSALLGLGACSSPKRDFSEASNAGTAGAAVSVAGKGGAAGNAATAGGAGAGAGGNSGSGSNGEAGSGNAGASGGDGMSAGSGGSGMTVGTGGMAGANGMIGTGGVVGTGGIVGSGGVVGTGGVVGSGGMTGCGSMMHLCPSGCAMNSSPATCGTTSCMPCAVPTNGSSTCNGTACGIMCNASYHSCDNTTCSSNALPATCGTRCTACPTPANGTATCDGTSCGVTCNANYHSCNNTTCASNTDATACGTSCTVCSGSPIANSAPTCNGTCGIGCATNYRACTGGSGLVSCNRLTYDFNDNTAQGWVAATDPVPPSAVTVATSTAIRRGTSGSSLRVDGTFGVFGSNASVGLRVPLCATGSENLNGRSVSAWIYFDTALPDCSPSNHDMGVFLTSASSANGMEVASAVPVVKTWFQVTGTVTNSTVFNAETAALFFTMNCTNNLTWPITFYVDDVTIGG